jgi:hypothetical protein
MVFNSLASIALSENPFSGYPAWCPVDWGWLIVEAWFPRPSGAATGPLVRGRLPAIGSAMRLSEFTMFEKPVWCELLPFVLIGTPPLKGHAPWDYKKIALELSG